LQNDELRAWNSPDGGFLVNSSDVAGPFFDRWLLGKGVNKFVSDDFAINHQDKLHMLFAGCSITVPVGISSEDGWSRLVYKDISEKITTSGYYNVSITGGSILEIIFNVFKYIKNYGKPDILFLLLPNITRDAKYLVSKKKNLSIVYNQYLVLDMFCRLSGIRLISVSWADRIKDVTDWIMNDDLDQDWEIFKDFDSYYEINKKRFSENVFDYAINNGTDKTIARDKTHPGEAFHYAWYLEMMDIYENHRN
jgi:hypothetical protein